jgi:alpha-beta hydrolase superfamily lysophospholipase
MQDSANTRNDCKIKRISFLLIWVAIYFPCSVLAEEQTLQSTGNMPYQFIRLKTEIKPLNLSKAPPVTPDMREYSKYYGLYFKEIRHFMGSFRSGDYILAAQIFIPAKPKATVFILHGYLDHSGIQKHIVRFCLNQGFAAALFDLPGHGLSGGESCSISDFGDYVSIFDDFINLCRPYLPCPYYAICHSLGCAIGFEYLNRRSDRIIKKFIFGAPLVRSAYWTLSKAHHFLAKNLVETVPRLFLHNSSDPEFMHFLKNDPLQCQRIPLRWVQALYAWNERVAAYPKISHPTLILQGTGDNVVDWDFNIPFLKRKNDAVTVKWFENAEHQLFNERLTIRQNVLKAVEIYLDAGIEGE